MNTGLWICVAGALLLAPIVQVGERPAPVEVPAPPQGTRPGEQTESHQPAGHRLSPEGTAADWFGAEGQEVSYVLTPLEPDRQGFSLLEFEVLGFSRGWASTLGLSIRDSAGSARFEGSYGGGASYSFVVPYEGSGDGEHTLVLSAKKQASRYALARHTGFARNRAGVVTDLSESTSRLGYLASRDERVSYRLDLAEGERAVVQIAPYRAAHRNVVHGRRAQAVNAALESTPRGPEALDRLLSDVAAERARQLPGVPWPALLEPGRGRGAAHSRQRLEFEPGPARTVRVDALLRDGVLGGIYELTVERNPALVEVAVRVGDEEDEPMADVHVWLLLEPDLETVWSGATGADGTAAPSVPRGEYTVLTLFDGRVERSHARVEAAAELNLIHPQS